MIHYHGSPLGGRRADVPSFFRGRNGCVSWLDPEDLPVIADVGRSFIIDNGAFTVWKQGIEEPDWKRYMQFVKLWCRHPRFNFCIIPDVVEGDEQDNRNLIKWWDKHAWYPIRVHGAPVWHLHESLEWLDILVKRWPIVCLGSSGKWSRPGTKAWFTRMDEVMGVACDKDGIPLTRLHGLRMLSPNIVRLFPFYSCDSTNVAKHSGSTYRFGQYASPNRVQRATALADRIESYQSPPFYKHIDLSGFDDNTIFGSAFDEDIL